MNPAGGPIGLGVALPSQPLHPFETAELAEVLGLVEDWLLHAGWDVHDSLTRFAGYNLTGNPPARLRQLIDLLGSYASRLRQLPTEQDR